MELASPASAVYQSVSDTLEVISFLMENSPETNILLHNLSPPMDLQAWQVSVPCIVASAPPGLLASARSICSYTTFPRQWIYKLGRSQYLVLWLRLLPSLQLWLRLQPQLTKAYSSMVVSVYLAFVYVLSRDVPDVKLAGARPDTGYPAGYCFFLAGNRGYRKGHNQQKLLRNKL